MLLPLFMYFFVAGLLSLVRNVSESDRGVARPTVDGHRGGIRIRDPITSHFWCGYLGPLGGIPSVPLGFR